MLMLLAQVDPKFIEHAADGLGGTAKENPVWVVVYALIGILVVIGLAALWWIKKGHPDTMDARKANRKDRADQAEADRKARAEEKALDRQLLKEVALASITQAQDGARATVSELTHEIGERVQDVRDEITASHETSRKIERGVAQLLARAGMAACLVGVLGCGPSEAQIRGMAAWSAAARASCRTPGQCPDASACIRGVLAASAPGAGRAEYKTAERLCWPYGGAE